MRAWGKAQYRLVRSWSKLSVSLPFNPVVVCLGKPVHVPPEVTQTRHYQIETAQRILDLAEWAYAWAGQAPIAPFQVAES